MVDEDRRKIIAVMDPGHGGSDSGCKANGIVEKDTTYRIASAARARLPSLDTKLQAFVTRDADVRPSFGERAAVARNAHADVAISLHVNASTKSDVAGLWLFWKSDCQTSRKLCEAIRNNAPHYFRQYPIRIWEAQDESERSGDEWLARPQHVLEMYQCPAVLVELGFATNPGDAAYLRGVAPLADFADMVVLCAEVLRRTS